MTTPHKVSGGRMSKAHVKAHVTLDVSMLIAGILLQQKAAQIK